MKTLLPVVLIFLLFPFFAPAQSFSGNFHSEDGPSYTVRLLIRPDSSFSLTVETHNPAVKTQENTHLDSDPTLYYDYHGVVHKQNDSTYFFDARLLLSFRPERDASPWTSTLQDSANMVDTRFDSVQAFFGRNWYLTYGNVTDSFCHRQKDVYYDNMLGYPRALNDSNHVLPYRYLHFALDTEQFKKAKQVTFDPGYVNPVTGLPVVFVAPRGYWPAFPGGTSWQGEAVFRNGTFVFEQFETGNSRGPVLLVPDAGKK